MSATTEPTPLDFSLKAHSSSNTTSPALSQSPQSSPHSSQSPSSTTQHAPPPSLLPSAPSQLVNHSTALTEALKLFQQAQAPSLTSAFANFPASGLGSTWIPGTTNPLAPSGGPALPDPAFYPTASLALSTLHRRRRPLNLKGAPSSPSISTDLSISGGIETPTPATTPSPLKKAGTGVPEEKKDALYWERRRKNNEAAKRSRDARRRKEEEVALRAAVLEQENLKLRAQVSVLKQETARLQLLLYSTGAQGIAHSSATVHTAAPQAFNPDIV